jgi:uncharacterized protein (TIGR00288 family)
MQTDAERALAIFVDFDNIAQGFRRSDRFDIQRVLKRMVEKGKIVAKKTYADWSRYGQYTASLHEAAFELVEIPKRSQTGKNSADIRLCVDAMDLAYAKPHIDTFVIVSGDSDFTPLVSKLKEMGKHVIGLGMQGSTSDLLRDNCDEFIYYEDLDVEKSETPRVDLPVPEQKRKALELLMEACVALRRENKEKLWASMIKETMKRKKPSFNETYHGFRTFSAMLEDAQSQGLVELERDEQRGTYVVVRFGDEIKGVVSKRQPAVKERGRRKPEETPPSPRALPKREPVLEPRLELPAPKPRPPHYQGFNEFQQESADFFGSKKMTSFEEEFPGLGASSRPGLESTSSEVMAKMTNEPRPAAVPETRAEEPRVAEEETGDKRKRRRRGRGKGHEEGEAAVPEEMGTVAAPVEEKAETKPVEHEPISFDDVPFKAEAAEPVVAAVPETPAEESVFFPTSAPPAAPPEPAAPAAPPRGKARRESAPSHSERKEPAERKEPTEPKEPAKLPPTKPESTGFGFGIFDE